MSSYRITYPFIARKVKGRKIAYIALKLVNKPGALMKVSQLLAKYNVNILSGIIEAPAEEKEAYWISQIDLTEADVPPEKIFEELKELDVVLGIEHGAKEIGEILLPPFKASITTLGGEAIVERDAWLYELYKALDQYFGVAGLAFMYHLGYRAGYIIGEKWSANAGVTGRNLLILGFEIFKALNWIKDYELVEFDIEEKRIRFRLYDSFECRPFKGMSKTPRSHYLRGILAGFISYVIGERISLIETRCLSKGDEYCEFVSRKPSIKLL